MSCLTRPPDLREEDEEVVKVADDGAEVEEEEEEELNSEACMEILQEALEEAAAAPQPHKYQPEPGGSQVLFLIMMGDDHKICFFFRSQSLVAW